MPFFVIPASMLSEDARKPERITGRDQAMQEFDAQLALDAKCSLGEGPVWWDGALWFVDIEGRALHRYEPGDDHELHNDGTHTVHKVPGRIGFAVPSVRHGWVIAQDSSVASFRPDAPEPKEPAALAVVEEPERSTRMNDGKCDPTGRLYAGTMHMPTKPGAGALYRFGDGVKPELVVDDVTISNGLAWHEALGRMYFIDTGTGGVDAFDWCPDTGEIFERRTVAKIENGYPDGMCIDRGGLLWVALWGGSRVACVDPEKGKEIGSVRLPCPNVTSCCFGGESLDQLWITTARIGMDDEALATHPHAGGLFVADVGAKTGAIGLPTTPLR
jgi:sugar lactone lactonase YvrE